MEADHAIDVQGIKKSYFGLPVLDGVSLQLAAGHFYALIGRNGSGKSTLMRILMHLEAPDQGDGTVAGYRLSGDDGDFFRHVGYANESLNYNSWLPLGEFFKEMGALYPSWDPALFDGTLAALELSPLGRFTNLSRGQRMQACVAFAFAIQPKVLLFDEITSVLDARARAHVLRLCKEFVSAGGTVVMATNIVSEIQPVADTLVYLEDRKINLVSGIRELSAKFIKLRRPGGRSHGVFEHPDCIDLRVGDDDSIVCLIPVGCVPSVPDDFLYPGKATAEDIFIYFTQSTQRRKP